MERKHIHFWIIWLEEILPGFSTIYLILMVPAVETLWWMELRYGRLTVTLAWHPVWQRCLYSHSPDIHSFFRQFQAHGKKEAYRDWKQEATLQLEKSGQTAWRRHLRYAMTETKKAVHLQDLMRISLLQKYMLMEKKLKWQKKKQVVFLLKRKQERRIQLICLRRMWRNWKRRQQHF